MNKYFTFLAFALMATFGLTFVSCSDDSKDDGGGGDDYSVKMPSGTTDVIIEPVTDEELSQQTDKVINLMREAEQRFSEEDQLFIKRLFAETNVLSAIYQYYELQELK